MHHVITFGLALGMFSSVLCTVALEDQGNGRYVIEGKVFPHEEQNLSSWQIDTRVHVNGGEFISFIKGDGSFVVRNVPSGSYIVEILHPDYMYEPVRVEINSKGKYRARKVNFIQPSQIIQVPYPLKMKALAKYKYFQVREQWRLTDLLFNPMVIMMLTPLIFILILPKIMNNPETKEDLKNIGNFAKLSDMPEMSEMITTLFNGGTAAKASTSKAKQVKKRQ